MTKTLYAALALLALPLPAAASLLVEESVNGSAFTTLCSAASGTSCAGSATTAGVTFDLSSATSNSPGTASLADLLSDTVSITNGGAANASITLLIGDTSYTMPTAPPTEVLESAIGTTVVIGGAANMLSYFSCVNSSDAQNSCAGGIATAAVTPSITAVGSSSAFDSTDVATLAAPYSMTEELTMTLAPGSDINYSASTRLIPPPPVSEPSSMAILAGAVLAAAWWYRRRARS